VLLRRHLEWAATLSFISISMLGERLWDASLSNFSRNLENSFRSYNSSHHSATTPKKAWIPYPNANPKTMACFRIRRQSALRISAASVPERRSEVPDSEHISSALFVMALTRNPEP